MFNFGVDYYPEHWPRDFWERDADLMQAAGFNVVRLAEFAWTRLEPADGQFEFGWLDDAIEVLGERGLRVILGTPTASTPPWLWHSADGVPLVTAEGIERPYGTRREYSPNSAAYRRYGNRITWKMAEHYADNPHVIGWQIDNEFGDRCYSEASRRAFQVWLQQKYGTLAAVNAAWGTAFWSHEYTDWSQVPVPLSIGHALHNPGLHLDYFRFMSDSYVSFQQEQIDILCETCPGHFITHNLMGFKYPNLDYFDLAAPLDFVSWDNYPRGFWVEDEHIPAARAAINHAMMRGLKHAPFWVMEQQSGMGAWDVMPPQPAPGEILLWAYQSIAHGADGIVFFRWRTNRFGAEQYWHGVLDHDGQPRRRYDEIKAMGEQLGKFGDRLLDAEPRAEVAIVHDYDTRFAFQIQPNNHDFDYPAHTAAYYGALHARNVPTEIVRLGDDLNGYKLLIVPAWYVVDPAHVEWVTQFAENGGVVVFTARAGVKRTTNEVVNAALPGPLAELCGVTVREYDSLLPGHTRSIDFNGTPYRVGIWCDVLEPSTAETLATYTDHYYAGEASITVNRVGDGVVIYVGTLCGGEVVGRVVAHALAQADVTGLLDTPEGVEVTARHTESERLLFVLNHSPTEQQVTLPEAHTDLLTHTKVGGAVTLAPYQVMILSEEA